MYLPEHISVDKLPASLLAKIPVHFKALHTQVSVCKHVCVYVHMYIHKLPASLLTKIPVHFKALHIQVSVCLHACTYVCTHVHMHVYNQVSSR